MDVTTHETTSQILASFREKFLSTSATSPVDEMYNLTDEPIFSQDSVPGHSFLPSDDYKDYTVLSTYPILNPKRLDSKASSIMSGSVSSPDSYDGTDVDSTFVGCVVKEEFPYAQISCSPTFHSDKPLTGSTSDADKRSADVESSTAGRTRHQHLLPPCRVCGDKASGFHYGANTCEACKGFFRRTLKKGLVEYECGANKDCTIQKGRRNNCPYCRYSRCLSIGMSKNAIKTGRYTHEKRTKDIVEVKQLSGDPQATQTSRCAHDVARTERPSQGAQLSPGNAELLEIIYSTHLILFPIWHKVLREGQLEKKMQAYAEQYHIRKSLLGSNTPSNDESTTASPSPDVVNVDGVATKDTLADHIQLAITVFVKFAKAIPGFTDLQLNDQAVLLKASRFEIWMIGAHKFMNKDLQVSCGPRGNSFHIEELARVMDSQFVINMFTCAHQLQLLNLSLREIALLKCIVLMFADRVQLQEPQRVEEIQMTLVACLQELINDGRRFSRVMSALINLRDLTEQHNTVSRALLMDWPSIHKHPLLVEIMSV